MRRTRHVVLPVRSWQYIGLLIVSLACLTLGLVSRDREGHAGNLAGPELTHRAPHEVDACPNLNPFVKSPIVKSEEVTKQINSHEMKTFKFRTSPVSRKSELSRSLSLDRLSRSDSREIRQRLSRNQDPRTIERLSNSRARIFDDESINRVRETRFSTITQSRDARNSFDPVTRISRSRDLSNRATDLRSAGQNLERHLTDLAKSRLENRRSRSTERREFNEIARRQNRVEQSANRRELLNLQHRTNYRDRQSFLTERRIDQQESREVLVGRREHRDLTRNHVPNHQSEIRKRKSVEHRISIEHRDAERSNREDRKNLQKSARFAQGDNDRNNNIDRRNWERSVKNRHALLDRVANKERRFSVATRGSRGDFVESDARRTLSRLMERSGVNDLNREALSRRIRSVESNTERSEEHRSFERRSLVRSMERREIDHVERRNRSGDRKSIDQRLRVSSGNLQRERLNYSQNRRDSRENAAIRENYRMVRSRYDVEETASRERRERFARVSRSVDRNSVNRREIAKIRDSRNYNHRSRDSAERRDLTQEQREKTNRLYQSREDQRITLQKSREAERRAFERKVPERRILERRIILNSARLDLRRLSEQRIDNNLKSREGFRLADRRSEQNLETRVSRGRVLERRSILDSRRSSERRIDDISKSREEFKITDLERSRELRVSRERIFKKRSILDFRRSSERRIDDNSKSREGFRLADRRLERNLESRVSHKRILKKQSILDSQRLSEQKIYDSSRSREGSKMQDRHVERNSELRNSMLSMERRINSKTASLENQILRSSEMQREIRRLTERRARSVENRPVEFRERESIRHLRQKSARNIEDLSRSSSLRRVIRVPEQNREQRRLSVERTLAKTVGHERLSAKWERNIQNARTERNMETRAKIIPNSMKDYEFFEYPMAYDLMRQAFVLALCTVYGFSLYNGKKSSLGSNIIQHAQRFIIW